MKTVLNEMGYVESNERFILKDKCKGCNIGKDRINHALMVRNFCQEHILPVRPIACSFINTE